MDQPDDAPGEHQIHVLYVEPSDRAATRQLDVEGDLRRSLAAINGWLSLQTGGSTFRFDTCDGAVDITFVKLAQSEAAIATGLGDARFPGPEYVRDRLAAAVKTTFHEPNKLYLIYWDGLAYEHCGGASYPPSLADHYTGMFRGGVFAATHLTSPASAGATTLEVWSTARLPTPPYDVTIDGQTVQVTSATATTLTLLTGLSAAVPAGARVQAPTTIPTCESNPLSSDGQALGYADFATAHELLHPLGIVGSGAADFAQPPIAPGHLDDRNVSGGDDLMYQGSAAWSCGWSSTSAATARCRLDPAHRNYWKVSAGVGVVDLSRSAFLSPTPASAELPPVW